MKRLAGPILIGTLLGMLAIPGQLAAAQGSPAPQYTLIDLGTFGGPNSFQNAPGQSLTNGGLAIGEADTANQGDPGAASNLCFQDCYISPGFEWRAGHLIDLGALPGPNSSCPTWISNNGLVAGTSEKYHDASSAPSTFPPVEAVLWKDGKIIDLGTLGGAESAAGAVNDRGQVVGGALNAVPDPFNSLMGSFNGVNCFMGALPNPTEARAFLWQNGVMHDLGTLGGPDAVAYFINDRSQVVGQSFTSDTPNPSSGVPTMDPFLWQSGHMVDLGTLGGTSGTPNWINANGQVIGTSNLAGDQTHHAFLWNQGKLRDLGTLGGANSEAFFVNESADVVGRADFSPTDSHHHAFLWKGGVMTDLGTLGGYPNSTAYGVNNQDQVIGDYGGDHGFLWENGTIYDLTSLLTPGTDIRVAAAAFINNRGEIYGTGELPNGDTHVILLEPAHRGTVADGLTLPAGAAASTASFTAWFDSTAPGPGMVLFGSGPGCSGLVETATQDRGAGTTSHVVQVQGNDLPGTVGDNGIVPGITYWYETITVTKSGTEVDNNGGKCYSVTVPPM